MFAAMSGFYRGAGKLNLGLHAVPQTFCPLRCLPSPQNPLFECLRDVILLYFQLVQILPAASG